MLFLVYDFMDGYGKAGLLSYLCRYKPVCLLRLLADVGQDAAVHVQHQAVDEVGGFGSQEDGGAAQVLGFAPAAGRGLGDDELVEGMTGAVGLNLTQRSGLRGGDVAGADAVALDVVSAVLGLLMLQSRIGIIAYLGRN